MKNELTDFDLGRLYERRETRDQLIAMAHISNPEQLKDVILAWLLDTMDRLPEGRIEIEETYLVIEA